MMENIGWARSPRGRIFGVCTGLAEWRGLDPQMTRLICAIIVICTGFMPGVLVYLILALVLPEQGASYQTHTRRKSSKWDHVYKDADDAEYTTAESKMSNEDLREEYESLKKKVEEMESEMFDKEKDWDERFNSGK